MNRNIKRNKQHDEGRHTPLVSIITPTYNRAYIIGSTIRSVLDQDYINWEHIIVDDGSTDDTRQISLSFNEPRIKYVNQKNKGPAAARNRGLEIAEGEWIAYLDSDNELFVNYLKVMMDKISRADSAVFAIPRSKRTLELYQNGKMIEYIDDSADFPDELTTSDLGLRTHHFDINGFIHSRAVIEAGIKYDESMRSFEDWEFALQIGERFPKGFVYVKDTLLNYHQRYGTDGLVSNASYDDWAKLFEYIYQKHKDDRILQDQAWYPDRVIKYRKLQEDFDAGIQPPPHLRPFKSRF